MPVEVPKDAGQSFAKLFVGAGEAQPEVFVVAWAKRIPRRETHVFLVEDPPHQRRAVFEPRHSGEYVEGTFRRTQLQPGIGSEHFHDDVARTRKPVRR